MSVVKVKKKKKIRKNNRIGIMKGSELSTLGRCQIDREGKRKAGLCKGRNDDASNEDRDGRFGRVGLNY